MRVRVTFEVSVIFLASGVLLGTLYLQYCIREVSVPTLGKAR